MTQEDLELDHARAMDNIETFTIGEAGRDFVKRLLHLDASRRMTADEALRHHFLRNSTYGNDLRKSYEDCIAGWRPGRTGPDLLQELRVSEPNRQMPPVPVFETPREVSPNVDPAKVQVAGYTTNKENMAFVPSGAWVSAGPMRVSSAPL